MYFPDGGSYTPYAPCVSMPLVSQMPKNNTMSKTFVNLYNTFLKLNKLLNWKNTLKTVSLKTEQSKQQKERTVWCTRTTDADH